MKKIINNKVYDTDTAKQIAYWDNDLFNNDFNYVFSELYKKKNGEYFLYEGGGANTRYAVSCGQSHWTGGSMIVPLTVEDADKWAAEHMDADSYQEEFGAIVEDDTVVLMSARIPRATKTRLDRIAASRGESRSDVVENAIELYARAMGYETSRFADLAPEVQAMLENAFIDMKCAQKGYEHGSDHEDPTDYYYGLEDMARLALNAEVQSIKEAVWDAWCQTCESFGWEE